MIDKRDVTKQILCISGIPIKILNLTPPDRCLFIISFLKIHSYAFRPQERHQPDP
jgi:hypothetical protein